MSESVTWIVIGSVFGGFFVITYFISAVKAVKDRKRLKIIRDIKRRARLERHTYTNQVNTIITPRHNYNGIEIPEITIEVTDAEHARYNRCKNEPSGRPAINKANGQNGEVQIKSKTNQVTMRDDLSPTTVPNWKLIPCSSTCQNDAGSKLSNKTPCLVKYDGVANHATILNPNNLSRDCVSVSKILRRKSYDVAVAQHSLLQNEAPSYATSKQIQTVYEGKQMSTAFENSAFNSDVSNIP